MIEERATITAIDDENIQVRSKVKSGCSGCKQVDTCGSGQVAKAIPQLSLALTIKKATLNNVDGCNADTLNVGDDVVIGISEKHLLQTAAQVYLWPIIALVVFSGLGQVALLNGVIKHELFSLTLGLVGAWLGYRLARYRLAKQEHEQELQPRLLRKICP